MRIKQPLLLLAITASLAACDVNLPGEFDVDETLPETRVQGLGTVSVLPSNFVPNKLDIKATADFKEQSFDSLTSVRIKRLRLNISANSEGATDTLEDGMPDNFAFMSEVSVSIVATINGARQTELVGSLPLNDPKFDAPSRSLELDISKANILVFIEAPGGYSVEISAQGTPPPDDVIFSGAVEYSVAFEFK